MIELFKKIFAPNRQSEEPVDAPELINQIKEIESAQTFPLGRRIHSFSYRIFQLCLDRDITKNYRITVYQGRDRIYSFTIFARQGNYAILEEGYSRVITFLDGDQKVANLPDNEIIKGFFYGY